VGVVPDLAWTGPQPRATMFIPASQITVRTMSVLVRSDGDPTALAVPVRQAIERIDPALPLFWVSTLEEVILQQTQGDAIMGRVMAVLGMVALLLSVIGVYGVMSYSVQQRVQEVGIRMALGAEARDVVKLMMRQGVLGAAVVASFVPALRSARVDPNVALRLE